MGETKSGWFERNYQYLRNTIAPIDPKDSKSARFTKNVGFGMFLILLVCGTLAIVVAASFMH